jgi:hypothetical protein
VNGKKESGLETAPAAMYVSYMKTNTYPLAVPADLLKEVRKAAQKTGLSMADTMRQSIKLGLPNLVSQLTPCSPGILKPLTREEVRRCFEIPDPEFDALSTHCATLPVPAPEE